MKSEESQKGPLSGGRREQKKANNIQKKRTLWPSGLEELGGRKKYFTGKKETDLGKRKEGNSKTFLMVEQCQNEGWKTRIGGKARPFLEGLGF